MDLRAGASIGPFRLIAPIGKGGMGQVWSARSPSDETVAVKLILPDHAKDSKIRQLFFEEVRIASALRHPNIVSFDGALEQDGWLFAWMECVYGASIELVREEVSRSGTTFPAAIVLRIALDVAAALGAAHGLSDETGRPLGLVHRDVSPHNLMWSRNGTIRLIDFGIAKTVTRISETTADVVKGKVRFLAPEQLKDGPVDSRADLWSLGVTLYLLCTGKFPSPDGDLEHLGWLLSDQPVPRLQPPVPTELAAILQGLLQKRPSHRIATAAELLARLERVAQVILPASPSDMTAFLDQYCGTYVSTRLAEDRPATWDVPWLGLTASVAVACGALAVAFFVAQQHSRPKAMPSPQLTTLSHQGSSPTTVAPTMPSEPTRVETPAAASAPLEKTLEAPRVGGIPKAHPAKTTKPSGDVAPPQLFDTR